MLDTLQVVLIKCQYNSKYKHQYNCYYCRDFLLMSMLRSTHLPYRAWQTRSRSKTNENRLLGASMECRV